MYIHCTGGDTMPYEEKAQVPARLHSLTLEGRERLSLSGVEDVHGRPIY